MNLKTTVCIALLACLFAVPTHAQQSKSLDEQLFEDLVDEPIPEVAPPEKSDGKPMKELDRQLNRDLGGSDPGTRRGTGLLREVADAMERVRGRLRQRDLSGQTRQMQTGIVGSFNELIKQLKKQKQQQQQQGGGQKQQQKQQQQKPGQPKPNSQQKPGSGKPSGKPSNSPAKDSSSRLGKAETAEATAAERDRMMQEAWGNLPASVRQQMQSARPEKFLPGYSRMIEEYFKRLSESPAK